jgi:hypothetical protein
MLVLQREARSITTPSCTKQIHHTIGQQQRISLLRPGPYQEFPYPGTPSNATLFFLAQLSGPLKGGGGGGHASSRKGPVPSASPGATLHDLLCNVCVCMGGWSVGGKSHEGCRGTVPPAFFFSSWTDQVLPPPRLFPWWFQAHSPYPYHFPGEGASRQWL